MRIRFLCAAVLALMACAPMFAAAEPMGAREVQNRLIALNYLPAGAASGSYDDATRQAVMAFQGYERLGRDGVVGPKTRAALRTARRPVSPDRTRGLYVDIDRQVLFVVGRSGQTLRVIHVSTGRTGNTPRGVYSVYRRERMSWSVPFSSWMPYAVYFTGGFALHEYPQVPPYPASAGCVRLPADQAPYVWRFAGYGTRVRVA